MTTARPSGTPDLDAPSHPTQAWDAASEDVSENGLPQFDRYVLQKQLGKGGFAAVYLAHDRELNRCVALKIPHERYAGRSAVLKEARVTARLRHHGIVAVLDVIRGNENRWVIVSDYIEGDSLTQVLRRGARLPNSQIAIMMAKVARALHFAHINGLVHRDIKPGNILIRNDGEPFITDFGIALHEDLQDKFRGDLSGTPYYMAPEQVHGQAHHLDGRTDEWAFGCVLYELLTSRRPFHGHLEQLKDDICNRDPKPLRQRNDAIPRELEQVCLKCLSKEVTDRYPTMLDVAEELERWVEADRSLRLRALPVARPRRVKRGWLMAGTSAIVLFIALATALALSTRSANDYKTPLEIALTPGRWHDLPRSRPMIRQVAFTPNLNRGRWLWLADTESLILDSREVGLIGFGNTVATDYQIQVQMSRAQWDSTADCGLFVGLRPGKSEEGHDGFFFHSIGLDITSDHRAFISRGLMHLRFTQEGNHFVDGHQFKDVQVKIHPTSDVLLQVEVRNGQISNVLLQGQVLNELTDLRNTDHPILPPCTGEFGVANSRGSTRFHNCRIMFPRNSAL